MIKLAYKNLAKKIKPDFIVITGDFCHYKDYPQYDRALSFLNLLVQAFMITKDNVFMVPGNHDVHNEDFPMRAECVSKINESIHINPDAYSSYMHRDMKDLRQSFVKYDAFVRSFYGDTLSKDDCRITSPSDVIAVEWKKQLNIIMLNTALVSKNDSRELFDIKKFLELENNLNASLPAIVLAHHSIDDIAIKQKEIAISFMKELNVKAYLCGDKHQCENKGISSDFTNPIPMFISGKSVPQVGDKYSDITILLYDCNDEGIVHVCPYEWYMDIPQSYFTPSSKFYVDTDKRVSFQLYAPSTPQNDKLLLSNKFGIGDTLKFGNIDNIPIEWRILDKQKGKMLIFCTHGISSKPFCNNATDISKKINWNNCSLRKWLNSDFITECLLKQEKWIQPSKEKNSFQLPVTNEDNSDKVFLLSEIEVKKYLNDLDYNLRLHNKCSATSSEFWWLRTPGQFDNFIQGVLEKNNSIDKIGNFVCVENIIRPAMWIDASFIMESKGEKYEK